MNLIYNREQNTKNEFGVFLAGPSYRNSQDMYNKSWRNQAIRLLEKSGYQDTIYIPQNRPGKQIENYNFDLDQQMQWQTKYMNVANIILFWIPRSEQLPGFTTNIEIGQWFDSGKIIIGAPVEAIKNQYLKKKCQKYNIKWENDLTSLVLNVINRCDRRQQIWFTSDTHFTSKRTLELSKRPFITVQQMNLKLISNWNGCINPNDIVFHLGDFGEPESIKYLNGKIILLNEYGDQRYDNLQLRLKLINYKPDVSFIKENYQLKLSKNIFKLIHIPQHGVNKEGIFFLYGHAHGSKFKRNGLNVGVDCHNYKPINLQTVLFYKDAIIKYYDQNVFLQNIGE